MLGSELIHDPSLSRLERGYIALFGIPINGLRNRARRVLPYVKSHHKTILDAGCGQGIFTFEIARRFPHAHITGVDIDQPLLQRNRTIAQKRGYTHCSFEEQDLTRMSYHNQFDLLLNVDNLEHIEEDLAVLQRFHQALKPGGELILHVPGYYRRWFFFRWKVNFDIEGHYRPGYHREELEDKLKQSRFEILESYYTYGWLETITNNISYKITGARMKRKTLYALVFPVLLFFSYLGRNSRPTYGAGVLIRARKGEAS